MTRNIVCRRGHIIPETQGILDSSVDELEEENQDLREQLAELQEVVDSDPASRDYESLTRPQKVHRVRRSLVEQAASAPNGRVSMKYKEIVWLLDGNPSPGHAYDLMELAGQLDGFNYDDPEGDRQKRITVKLDAVNDEALVHAANKARAAGGG